MIALSTGSLYSYGTARVFELAARVGYDGVEVMRINSYAFNHPAELSRFPHLTLDTTHLGTWGLDPLAVYERLRERVVHVHLSNYDGKEHRSPPDGGMPLAELLRRLAHDGYAGAITVEAGPDSLDARDEGECLAALRRALAFCRGHFAR